MKVLKQQDKLHDMDARVFFVVHDEEHLVRRLLLRDLDVPFPVLVDADREAYSAWGLRRSSVPGVWLDPHVWARYIRLIASGERIKGAGRDTLQLGGDFVIDASGQVTYSRPQVRDDRPPVLELMGELRAAAQDGSSG